MKNLFKYSLASALALGLLSCSKKEDTPAPVVITEVKTETKAISQPHDQNTMMKIMHKMMDKMDMMTMTNDIDVNFANTMMMHHDGAIEMANEELKSGDNAQMKAMATKVITAQSKEKDELMDFVMKHTAATHDTVGVGEFNMKDMMSMDKMDKAADLRVVTGDADNDFATLLIVHHQAALESAQAELDHGKHTEIKNMAKMMIMDQGKEIKELQDWLIANKPY